MRFWTADLHFGHARILELCPFRPWPTVEAMDQGLINLWNQAVGPGDDVWILGDLAMGRIRETLRLLPRLHGRKFLVPGNHDRCSPAYPHRRDPLQHWVEQYLEAGIWSIEPPGRRVIAGIACNISHYPYLGQGDGLGQDRSDPFRLEDDGLPLLHGHVHTAWQVRGRMINVGVDLWRFQPVPEPVLAEVLRAAARG